MNIFEMFEANKKSSVVEAWSQKYKSSINCSHPKGFSQKAHCAGKKKHNESVEMEMVCEDCGMCEAHGNITEIKKGQKDSNGVTKCWPGKHAEGTKKGRNGGQVRNCVPNEGVAKAKHQPRWEVEQRTAGHHSAFYIVRGHSKPREVWKDSRGMSDFRSRAAAEAKAAELNSQEMTEAFQDDGKMDWDAWKQKAKQHGAVKFVDTDNKTIAYDKNSKQVSSITWSSKKKGVAEGKSSSDKYIKLLKNHDWTYDYSDDDQESQRGYDERQVLLRLAKKLDPKFKIWNKYAPDDIYKKNLSKPKDNYDRNDPDNWYDESVEEGKPQKKADRYHINKDGKPASLASYADRDSAVKDRDAKYPDAKVHQVGPRGKVKGEFEEGVAEAAPRMSANIVPGDNLQKLASAMAATIIKDGWDNTFRSLVDFYDFFGDHYGDHPAHDVFFDLDDKSQKAVIKAINKQVKAATGGDGGAYNGERNFEEGVAENWGEPLTGWHVVYARTGNKVSGTPNFDSRDSAQKYLMTKMSADHHNYRVAHADNLGTSAPTPMGGYLEENNDEDQHGYLPTNLKLGAYRDEWDPRDYSAYPDEFKSNEHLREIVYNLVEEGVEPKVEVVFPTILTATQDWLADDRYRDGDPVFEEYEDHPVVLKLDGEYYILDGHHRCSRALAAKRFVKIYMFVAPQGVAEGVDIGQEWMSDTELDQYVPERLQQQWRELLGYDENGNPSALWANLTGGYEPDVNDPQHRALMVKVANKWFSAKKIPNVKFFDVKDADDELEWLVQIGQHGVAEAGHAGADDTDTVGFYLDTERAYQAVMGRYGDMIDHDETSGIMYVPARLWPKIEMIAFDADGIGALRDDDLENPEHYGIAEAAVMESRLQEMRDAGYDIL